MKLKNRKFKLSDEINKFIVWYDKNCPLYAASKNSNKIKNFIEKMAVWYELRYPDCEVQKRFFNNNDNEDISFDLFDKNPYISNALKNCNNEINLKWETFYNFEAFYITLSKEEQKLIEEPCYPGLVYIYNSRGDHFHLQPDGKIDSFETEYLKLRYGLKEEEIKSSHIKDIVKLLEKNGINLPETSEVRRAINTYDKKKYIRDGIFDCVMYRIIERGSNGIGPKRAFLFAKEFDRNIDIPMMYGVDYSDPALISFVENYLQSGGNEDLVCLVNYDFKTNRAQKNIKVKEIIVDKYLKLTNLY